MPGRTLAMVNLPFGSFGPELVVVPVVIPSDKVAIARAPGEGLRAGEIGVGQANGQMRQLHVFGLRVVQDDLAGDRAALVLVRIITPLHPVKWPLSLINLGLDECVVPKSALALAAQAGGTVGLPSVAARVSWSACEGVWDGQRVAIDKNRTDDLVPVFPGRDVALRAPGVVAGGPVIKRSVGSPCGINGGRDPAWAPPPRYSLEGLMNQMPMWLLMLDQPYAGKLIRFGTIAVFVLDGIFVDAGGEDALFLGVDDDARAQIVIVDMGMLRSASTESQLKSD